MRSAIVFAGLVIAALSVAAFADAESSRAELGKSIKLRILVDKVMQPEAKWVTQEWMVKAAADAGFNVFSPRAGYDRLDEVKQVAEWCKEYNIFFMPWMRGSLTAPDGPTADGKRVVWADGNAQPLWSPNSDEFWEWTNRYIVEYAKISKENPYLMGVFLDYENYAPGKEGNLYSLSYDDLILNEFGKSNSIATDAIPKNERKAWLEQQGLHEKFKAFQIDSWRRRCHALREAVDAICPTFQFCVYPAPGTPFIVQAVYPEWSTVRALLILADACTYGRPSRFQPEQQSLEGNRKSLLKGMKVPREAGIPFMYAGGIDPVVRGADPEFCGKNAVMISETTNGYWIFYEGPTYTEQDHADYWKWFTWANKAIAEGRFDAQKQARETPENWFADAFQHAAKGPRLVAPAGTGETIDLPSIKLRGENLVIVAATAGKPAEIVLQDVPVGSYDDSLLWELRNPAMEAVGSGTIPHGQSGSVSFTPPTDGLYLLAVCSGSCAWQISKTNVPVALHAADGLAVIYGAKRLYFDVPSGTNEFTLTIKGQGAETVRLNVFNPSGRQVATGQTTKNGQTVQVAVKPGDAAGRTCSLELTRADEGVLEDSSITIDAKLPPTLSLVPEHVFKLN